MSTLVVQQNSNHYQHKQSERIVHPLNHQFNHNFKQIDSIWDDIFHKISMNPSQQSMIITQPVLSKLRGHCGKLSKKHVLFVFVSTNILLLPLRATILISNIIKTHNHGKTKTPLNHPYLKSEKYKA